ncbi:unnamed protein product, partial [Nesidiocoris tenuis]
NDADYCVTWHLQRAFDINAIKVQIRLENLRRVSTLGKSTIVHVHDRLPTQSPDSNPRKFEQRHFDHQ